MREVGDVVPLSQQREVIIGLGDGAEQSHYTRKPFWNIKIDKKEKFLLRECPDCGESKLRKRQRYCDNCTKNRRQKTQRKNYYNKRKGYDSDS